MLAGSGPSGRRAPQPAAVRRPGRGEVVAVALAVLLAAVVLVVTCVALAQRAVRPEPMTPYVAPLWWLGYSDGFVRRGLPGALLRMLAGGPPSLALANAAGVALTVAGVVALVALAVALARRAPDRWSALAVAAAVLVTPFGVSLTARDLGRPDALGVLVAVVLVTVPWARLPPPLAVVVVALLTSAAVGAEELLAVLVLLLAGLALQSAFPRARPPWPALAVLPGLVLAGLSALAPLPFGGRILQSYDITVDFGRLAEVVTPLGPLQLLGSPHLVTSVFFDIGVYLVVIGVMLDLARSLGSGIDQHEAEDRAPSPGGAEPTARPAPALASQDGR